MFSPAVEKQRRQLYAQTHEGVARRLPDEATPSPDAVFAALRWGMEKLETAYADTPAKIRSAVACRSGCGHCCNVSIDVQAHEVLFAADHIQTHFPPDALARVIAHTAARRARLATLAPGTRDRFMSPCALLYEGACTIYAGRPEACRVHHASDASVCAAHIDDPSTDLDAVFIPPLRARMFAVMLGMDAALEEAGFDDRAYDFGAALHEALTNSLSLALWLRRKPAFPDSCLAEPDAGA